MECLREWDCGSVETRASLVKGVGEGVVGSVDRVGASTGGSNLEFVGTSREVPGEASSGFAMRKPPKDCERLKSSSMAP
jgi:hypothetical protein